MIRFIEAPEAARFANRAVPDGPVRIAAAGSVLFATTKAVNVDRNCADILI